MAASVFLDANIILELFFQRSAYTQVVDEIIALPVDAKKTVSILSIVFFMYHTEKEQRSLRDAHRFLAEYEVLDMNESDYAWAQVNDQGDFEDALQVACAIRHGCKKLLTLDKILVKNHNKHIAVKLIG